ncbi:MAG: MoaD/ThiS family protein [Metallosphaera sp.]
MTIIKVKVYPDLESTVIVEVNIRVAKEALEALKDLLKLKGQYAIVKNGRILSNDEDISDNDEITLVPIVEGG